MPVVLIKLGGSLVTDKRSPYTLRPQVIAQLAKVIAAARRQRPDLQLVIGNGAGSFGHVAVHESGFANGVPAADDAEVEKQALAYAKVAAAVARLNGHIREALLEAGVPAVSLPPSSVCRAKLVEVEAAGAKKLRGAVASVDADLFRSCLSSRRVPCTHGDVALVPAGPESELNPRAGHAVCSTESVFAALAPALRPELILLLGEVAGVFTGLPPPLPLPPLPPGPVPPRPSNAGDPHRAAPGEEPPRLIERLTEAAWEAHRAGIGGSHGVDVTGGMADKVAKLSAEHRGRAQVSSMFRLLQESDSWGGGAPRPRVFVAGGLDGANVLRALAGEAFVGTDIVAER
eukprot:tig00000455_g1008.t1